jgi:4-amino-4-deoxy-L-arabinose transferase-like glycosyltransferase
MNPPTPHQSTSGSRHRQYLGMLLVLTLVVRSAAMLMIPHALEADPDGYRRLAENLYEHGTFGYGDQPTAYRPPLYPLVLAPWMALGSWSTVAIGILHVVLGIATVAGVVRLSRQWGLERYALLAGALVAVDPVSVWHSTLVMTETLATFLTVLALSALTAAAQRPSLRRAMLAGGLIGLAALCRPTYLPWMAFGALVLPWFAEGWTMRLKMFVVYGFTGAVVLAPWVIRNQIQYGVPIASTTHGGYTLLLGNNPWFYDYLRQGAWGSLWDGNELDRWWLTQASRATPAEELHADRLAYQVARETIRQQPGLFVDSCLVHVGRLWSPLPHRTESQESWKRGGVRALIGAWYVLEYLLALLGLAAILRRREVGEGVAVGGPGRRFPWLATWGWGLSLALVFTAVHSVYWSNIRMRTPLMPLVVLAAVAGVAVWQERTRCSK